ncbi:hypothetical protein [Cellulomonas sp. HZM]|uniref:hypothetical protein n=1 Tax=Cellulomonas sp. HZM TaxID=1454010 RepID=UPI0018CC6101|nr:hypothetical protein [Cellulomonas sp. HZM]
MGSEIELVSDGDGLAVIGDRAAVDRFLLSAGLDRAPARELDVHRLWSVATSAGAATQIGSEVAANSGRWVKLTAESAEAVKKYGLMPTKKPGISHAMAGQRGDIKQWLQIENVPTLLGGPFALTALATMMQQRAMQEQMDEIVEYLREISEKVDEILRRQKDAVLADMIGVDLIVEEALTVRDQVGRVSEVTWSKVQSAGMTIARTQAYAIRQLDGIAEKLETKADLGDVGKATREAEPQVREWLAVIARTFQLQDGVSILELDRVLDAAPQELDSHRLGLQTARRNRLELISTATARLLTQMNATVQKANSKVLLNPFDAPAAVRSSNDVATGVLEFRARLGIESGHESVDAKGWRQAATETRDKVVAKASQGAADAARLGSETYDRAAGAIRSVGAVGADEVAEGTSRARAATEDAGQALKGLATGVVDGLGARFRRKRDDAHDDIAPTDHA